MLRLTIATMRAKKARLLLSAVAIALGVAFVVGTLVLTDTLGRAYDDISADVYDGTDAVVRSDRVVTSTNDQTVRGTIDARVLAAVRHTPGVAVAEPDIDGVAQIVGADGRLVDTNENRATPIAFGWHDAAALDPMELVAGHAPATPDEVVIDRASARAAHFAVGDAVDVVTASGKHRYTLAGIATYGGADDAAGAHVVAFTPETAATAFGHPDTYEAIQVIGVDGLSESTLANRIRAALRSAGIDGVEAITGADATAEAQAANRENLGFLNGFLMAFAFVSLVVGSFVIANAFSITIAQRTREHALLRALGASKRQVSRTVVCEALVTGLVASLVGVALGIGAAHGLEALLGAFGLDLPDAPLVVQPKVVVVGVLVGTAVTVLATYLPARRAARVAPVAAMRDVDLDRASSSRGRRIAGSALTVGGAALVVTGFVGSALPAVGLGALSCFVGVVVLGPVIVRPVAMLLGIPFRGVAGVTGSIAVENARRNPKRTARTASSLMIGLGLVSFVTILGASMRDSFSATVDHAMKGDWIVTTVFGQGGVSHDAAEAIDALPETAAVTGLRYTVATVDSSTADVSAVDAAVADELVDVDLAQGSLADLTGDTIALRSDTAAAHGWGVGDVVTVSFPETGARRLTVRAIYRAPEPLGPYAVSTETFDANVADTTDRFVIVGDAPGTSTAEAHAAIEDVLARYPTTELRTGPEFASDAADQIGQVLDLMYALLALAVVIALFGVANTVALSVHERTRELGLLRAVGMSRRQVRRAVRYESVVISLLGTATGMAIGVGFAAVLVHALGSEGIDRLSLPSHQLLAIVVVGALAGVVTAALPARRAARLDILQALRAD